MLHVCLPADNIPERQYSLKVLLTDFLAIPLQFETDETRKDYCLLLDNANQLIIEDHFFKYYPEDKAYLNLTAIPEQIQHWSAEHSPLKESLPLIFGRPFIEVQEKDNQQILTCGADIVASTFFMLSRWEEYVSKECDEHDRFPAEASLACRMRFLKQPVVDQYAECLRQMLRMLGYNSLEAAPPAKLLLTHDIDDLLCWPGNMAKLRAMAKALLVERSFSTFNKYVGHFLKGRQTSSKDPYDTFDYLMDVAENHHTQAHFFFMANEPSHFDRGYNIEDAFVGDTLAKINQRGHVIGIHPAYNSDSDARCWHNSYERLSAASPQEVICGRQHYLRFKVPDTWQFYEDHALHWDSTMAYPEASGFRCGTAHEFPVFNILTRQALKLRERPLIVMDATYAYYDNRPIREACADAQSLKQAVDRYGGNFVVLWHNSSFYGPLWQSYKAMFDMLTIPF